MSCNVSYTCDCMSSRVHRVCFGEMAMPTLLTVYDVYQFENEAIDITDFNNPEVHCIFFRNLHISMFNVKEIVSR